MVLLYPNSELKLLLSLGFLFLVPNSTNGEVKVNQNQCVSQGQQALLTLEDYEKYAKENLAKGPLDYLQRGAVRDETLNENTLGLSKVKVVPRYLRNVGKNRTTLTTIFNGKTFKMPIGISPSSVQSWWHPQGENATIRAAAAVGTIMIVSSAASILIEDIVEAAPENTEKWLQTFLLKDQSVTNDFVRRAESSGFQGIVLTIDNPVFPLRLQNQKNGFKFVNDQHQMVNFQKYTMDAEGRRRDVFTWDDLEKFVNSTILPVIVKGILTPEDAKLAYKHGAKAIIVSNHGGRQLDGTISTIEALAAITREFPDAADKGFDIYMDSGIRSGLDVFRALALGAKFVFVGRAPIWGLFHSGQTGVENVLEILRNEFEIVMAQAGCASVNCISRDLVTTKF